MKPMSIAQIRLWIEAEVEEDRKLIEKYTNDEPNPRLRNFYEGRVEAYENILERTGGIL